jgi:hypothetical protein
MEISERSERVKDAPHSRSAACLSNDGQTRWTIKSDGTFDVDIKHHGKRDVWGTWTMSGDTVTVQETGGVHVKGCDAQAFTTLPGPAKTASRERQVQEPNQEREPNLEAKVEFATLLA